MSQGRSTPCIGDGHPTFNDGNPYNGYINPYGIGLMTIPYYMVFIAFVKHGQLQQLRWNYRALSEARFGSSLQSYLALSPNSHHGSTVDIFGTGSETLR